MSHNTFNHEQFAGGPPPTANATSVPALPGDHSTLPESLRPDGLIRKQLDKVKGIPDDYKRYETLKKDFDNLINSSVSSGSGLYNPNAGLDRRLINPDRSSDAVLRVVIADQEGLNYAASPLQGYAEKTYQENPDFYHFVFGELLPQSFIGYSAEQAYLNGINPTAATDLTVFLSHLEAQRQSSSQQHQLGLSSGIAPVDNALHGLRDLTLVTGHKGAGKTTFVLSVVSETLKSQRDMGVLVYSLDMPKDRIYSRLLCVEAGITFRQLLGQEELTESDTERLKIAEQSVRSLWSRLRIVERNYAKVKLPIDMNGTTQEVDKGLSVADIANDCKNLKQESGATKLLIVIDMLPKWIIPGTAERQTEPDVYRMDALDQLRKKSRTAACPEGFPIIVTSEVRKDAGHLTIDDLKGDGRITSDADTVLLMSAMEEYNDLSDKPVPVKLEIAKTRDGGRRGIIPLMFDHVHYRFHEPPAKSESKKTRRETSQANSVNPFGT